MQQPLINAAMKTKISHYTLHLWKISFLEQFISFECYGDLAQEVVQSLPRKSALRRLCLEASNAEYGTQTPKAIETLDYVNLT